MMTVRQIAVSLVVLGALSGTASAQQAESERLIKEGLELRRQGKNREALIVLQKAHALLPTSRASAQLGFAEQALGLSVEAEKHVSAALADEGDPFVRRNRTAIVEALAVIRAGLATVLVEVTPASATVVVNGKALPERDVGKPTFMLPGPTVITARAPGHQPQTVNVTLARGVSERVVLQLPRAAGVPAAGALPSSAAPAGGLGARRAGGAGRDDGGSRRMAGLVVLSAGGLAVAGGVTCMLIANSKAAAIDRDANAGRPYREHNGNFTTYRTLSGISYGVGAAALLAGGWLLWTADEGSAQALSEGVLTPALRAGPLSLGFGGTF